MALPFPIVAAGAPPARIPLAGIDLAPPAEAYNKRLNFTAASLI